MKEIFEHFVFIKPMCNMYCSKVQDAAFWSAISTSIVFKVTHGFSYVADNVVGISLYMLVAFFALMVLDYITGYRAARKEGEEPESKKGLRWVVKLFAYLFSLYLINALAIDAKRLHSTVSLLDYVANYIPVLLEMFKYIVLFFIIRWETKSVDENFHRLGYKFKIFGVFDLIFDALVGVFNKNYKDKTGIDEIIKKEKENETSEKL